MRTTYMYLACALTLLLPAASGCADDGGTADTATGDGDGDSTGDGDGDGDPSGDGDGDGDPSGDGDGDPSGDGDGDGDGDSGDGDGDGDSGDGDGDSGDGDGDPLPTNFLEQLTQAGGCGDVYIGVTNPGATIGLMFNGAPLCQLAYDMGGPQVRVSQLPSTDVELRLVLGTSLDEGCSDVAPGPQISTQWDAVSGTVTLTVEPTGNMPQPFNLPADATLELTDVTFESNGLDPVVIDSLIVSDVAVGWFPG
jgi:hypothetical protein